MNQRQDSLVRGVDALGIEFLGQVRLVVESLANITQQLKRHDDKVSRELDEIRALCRLSNEDPDARVRKLEAAR